VLELLVDENLPRSLAPRLRAAGFKVQDVRDLGLRGASDADIFSFARSNGLVLLTSDLGFGGRLRAMPDSPGVVLARLPNEWATDAVNELIERSLSGLPALTPGSLVVLEPERIRIRTFL
jgi:predicted nuclease of predicted toxin-antitoxin system